VQAAATAKGGTLGEQMSQVANNPTAVWMDRIAAITAGRGLAGHLDAALAQQQSSGKQVVIEVVIYDLPNRDCAAIASNGELLVSKNGLAIYKSQFIDPIAATLGDPKYSSLRIVMVIEPDSLPNLVTNTSIPLCAEAQSSGAYVQGVQYALNKLHAIPNVYNYIDIAHSAWLGWPSNLQPAVDLITNAVKGTTAGLASIDGFISDTANYTPVSEPFMPDTSYQVGGQPIKAATFYQYNPYNAEAPYDLAMHDAFVADGFPGTIGMLIDTSRDGWGGANRPTAASTSTDLNTYVNASRIDRRYHRGNWCNQNGAGIGARPQANPIAGIAAFVWIKPPGESDGTINPNSTTHIDSMCDPNYTGKYGVPTGALPNSPLPGQFFEAEFEQLVQNAYPAFS
jgi:cellulose 1,4-beta-cellobiosidase